MAINTHTEIYSSKMFLMMCGIRFISHCYYFQSCALCVNVWVCETICLRFAHSVLFSITCCSIEATSAAKGGGECCFHRL